MTVFFKKPECKTSHPCIFIAIGMMAALGAVACTKPGRKFIKSKVQNMQKKSCGCDAAQC